MNAQHLISGDDIPYLLRHIAVPPKKLWIESLDSSTILGETSGPKDPTKYLCIVGARKHSTYGREACEKLISGLSGYNICIVSGLALGIDSVAHEAALKAGLQTLAFPGSGLDRSVLYPPSRHGLAKRIVEAGGALISEYEPTQHSMPWTFPQRNRLMAGMSHATLVIEAANNSGTLITAMYANEEGRDVLALPGDIFSPLTYGPHKLIRSGAALGQSSLDILEALGIEPRNSDETISATSAANLFKQISDPIEQKIIKMLSIEPIGRENIHKELNIDISTLNTHISMLELNGYIRIQNGILSIR